MSHDPSSAGGTFRVGLVGAGYVSEFHIRALQRLPEVRITGITDLLAERAGAVAARFGLTAYPSLEAMAAAGLDVVHVLTPPASHTRVAVDALHRGCHVLVEKPLATTVEECDRLSAESAAAGRQVCVGHSMLTDPIFARMVAAVRQGAVGDVLTVDVLRSSIYPPYHGGPLPPQYGDGGYPFRDLGVHALYMLRELLGPIEDVTAEFRTAGALASDPNLYFDEWRALVRCERGSGQVQLSWNARPLQHLFMVQGTRGALRADLYSMFITQRRNTPAPKAIERVLNALAESAQSAAGVAMGAGRFALGRVVPYQGLHDLVREFYRCLAAGRPMPVTLESARDIVEWTERVARPADAAKAAARPRRPA
ncbi:MAG: Gfo/Idh/MocA family protein, partial [Candidatus Rokuibacteriota bacterium]